MKGTAPRDQASDVRFQPAGVSDPASPPILATDMMNWPVAQALASAPTIIGPGETTRRWPRYGNTRQELAARHYLQSDETTSTRKPPAKRSAQGLPVTTTRQQAPERMGADGSMASNHPVPTHQPIPANCAR